MHVMLFLLRSLSPQCCRAVRALVAPCAFSLGLLLAAVSAVSAAEATSNEAPHRGGTLEYAIDSEPPSYDCHAGVSFATLFPLAPHYSTLLKFDTANYPQVEGDVAEAWTVSADKRTYTFTLRPDIHFHDGSRLTSADVKATYERIVHPPPGVLSARQVNYAAIQSIETPDPRTVIFHLAWSEAAMLEDFSSEWNCIYSAKKLAEDPLYPSQHVMGSGPFTFVEHVKGDHWTGKRFDGYFMSGKPYLDGFKAHFVTGEKMVDALKEGRIMADFRFVTPNERDALVEHLGDKVSIYESPTLLSLVLVFNTQHPPFDDARVRQALSLAIDRWHGAEEVATTSVLKFVGGLMRPGSDMATPQAQLETLPGFSHDIAASRAEARRLLKEAGITGLTVKLTNRDIPMPYAAGAQLLREAWQAIGVTVEEKKLSSEEWTIALALGNFDATLDFAGDYFDDPSLQLTKYVSRNLSPVNFSNSNDSFLDALYVGQAVTADQQMRTRITREFERHALAQAYTVPILWYNRIVPVLTKVKGWNMTPSQYIGQDLSDLWLDGAEN
jgi:peptide/nickel transport system substrate-binding protein